MLKNAKARKNIVVEILQTENTYVSILKFVVQNYMVGLGQNSVLYLIVFFFFFFFPTIINYFIFIEVNDWN